MKNDLKGVDLSIIRYANCWEDARLLLHALPDAAGKRLAIVASAGDNALALLSRAPEKVIAFDISLPQLYLTELKQTAFDRLPYDDLIAFLGVSTATPQKRWQLWQHLAPHLSPAAKDFWQLRKECIQKGINHCGKFERYFRLFRRFGLPLVHRRQTVTQLLRPKSDHEQAVFYKDHWNSFRWRLLMRIFFSKWVMGRAGRDPKFLEQVRIPVAQYIRQRAEAHLQSTAATENPFLHAIFTGHFSPNALPVYLFPENYETIRSNLSRLDIRQASADDLVADENCDAFCLSNIFEYFPDAAFADTVADWKARLASGVRLLFWNLMVPRHFSTEAPDAFERLIFENMPTDNGFFYSDFVVEQKK